MKSYQRFSLLLSTVRHLTAGQVWHRARHTIHRRWWSFTGRKAPRPHDWRLAHRRELYAGLCDITAAGPAAREAEQARFRALKTSNMEFCFLEKQATFDPESNWNDPTASQLWRYHLHYFNYVQDLLIWGASGDLDASYAVFRRLARSWIERNGKLEGDGWHPYTISLRVVNWIHASSFYAKQLEADAETRDLFFDSLYGQVQILFGDLELDVRGNHLLENLRALVWAGLTFAGDEARRWFEVGLRLLEREVQEQVLSDGGHFERSPGYQLVVFKDLLEIALWLKRNDDSVGGWLDEALRRMHKYVWTILAPDGSVPLLKDTAWDAAPNPHDLLAAGAVYFGEPACKYADHFGLYPLLLFGLEGRNLFESWSVAHGPRRSTALAASGHYIVRDEQNADYLIFDAGKPCPDYLPAHAHADLLTYELSSHGQRVVVDSGVYEYQAGAWRDFFRSTRAHNTVEVNGENQSEVWGSFRVGRRAKPGPVRWQSDEDYTVVQAEHDGYLRLKVPVVHQRTIVCRQNSFWLVVDQLWGAAESSLTSYVHLHPELSFQAAGTFTWQILSTRAPLWLKSFGAAEHSIVIGQADPVRQGWYSEIFGSLRPNSVLALHRHDCLPVCWGYVITREANAELQTNERSNGHEVRLHFGEKRHAITLIRNQPPILG